MKLIAAVLVLALVASSQAFPGSDPVSQYLMVAPQHTAFFLKDNPISCLLQNVPEITECGGKIMKVVQETVPVLKTLVTEITACVSSDPDKIKCTAQAIRGAWEGNKQLRKQYQELAKEVANVVNDIQTKCFAKSMY